MEEIRVFLVQDTLRHEKKNVFFIAHKNQKKGKNKCFFFSKTLKKWKRGQIIKNIYVFFGVFDVCRRVVLETAIRPIKGSDTSKTKTNHANITDRQLLTDG